jgi:hypothetical protein
MEFDLDRVRANVKKATTEDLLVRATVYRAVLEPEALPVILAELRSRGVSAEDVLRHEGSRRGAVLDRAGVARKCAKCDKPAVTCEWGWHYWFGKVPILPRPYYLCEDHRTSGDYDEKSVESRT